LASTGADVTVVETAPYLLPRQLDAEGAAVLQSRLEALGLRLLTGIEAAEIRGGAAVREVALRDGRILPADAVLFSTGIAPRLELARGAGLAVSCGVVVDGRMRTSAPDVFAAGDVAAFGGRLYGLVQPALEQARAAAAAMAGVEAPEYAGTLPAAALKVAGIDLSALGDATADGEAFTVLRKTDGGAYRRLALKDGKLAGAVFLGTTREAMPAKQLIASKKSIAAWQAKLLDPDFDWPGLAKGTLPEPQ
jgi:nitrite reductase (NADH) large subunit